MAVAGDLLLRHHPGVDQSIDLRPGRNPGGHHRFRRQSLADRVHGPSPDLGTA